MNNVCHGASLVVSSFFHHNDISKLVWTPASVKIKKLTPWLLQMLYLATAGLPLCVLPMDQLYAEMGGALMLDGLSNQAFSGKFS